MPILKNPDHWRYRETARRVRDSLVLRRFCRVALHTLTDGSHAVALEHALNDRVVELAARAKVTRGASCGWMRPVCKRPSITPPESGLLVDSVRVRSRFVQRATGLVNVQVELVQQVCRSRLRSARQAPQILHRHLRRKTEEQEAQQKELYQKLIQRVEPMVRQTRGVVSVLSTQT
jgi:transposase, IS5 family